MKESGEKAWARELLRERPIVVCLTYDARKIGLRNKSEMRATRKGERVTLNMEIDWSTPSNLDILKPLPHLDHTTRVNDYIATSGFQKDLSFFLRLFIGICLSPGSQSAEALFSICWNLSWSTSGSGWRSTACIVRVGTFDVPIEEGKGMHQGKRRIDRVQALRVLFLLGLRNIV